ncbi:hypothetical protein MHU86_6345 [Fragilaria crotonensis]|nr:hypothetical protein MHU86_6345 [Fragilaria crotonensis]
MASNGAPAPTGSSAVPMFAPSNPTAAEAAENVDLDELFRDCYFGDFPVPPFATGPGGDEHNMDGSSNKRSADDAGIDDDGDTKHLTDQQKIERRERNREHAKRSRLRKKFLLESLQEQIHGLQAEIETLKDIIKDELPEKSDAILKKLTGDREKFTPLPMPSGFGPVKTLMEPDFRLMSALSGSQQNFAISDPSLPDNPIVYVSQGFLDLTGYTLDQVLGRNCRFLQGPGTDQSAVEVIRRGIKEGVDTSVCLLNYKVDGTPFWNQFFVAALRDAENNVVNFVGVQCEVSKAVVEKQMSEGKTPASAFAKANVA